MVMDFSNDPQVTQISDQYMFGPSLMICPVSAYKVRERDVYFPASEGWYDLYTGKYIRSAQKQTVNAPYEQMPIYVRAGSIIPIGPEIQFVGQKPNAPITLYVYSGADAEFVLYEDEGINYNYEKGAYSKIEIQYNEQYKKLTIKERDGSFTGMVNERTFNVVFVGKSKAIAFDAQKTIGTKVVYEGKEVTIQL